MKILFALAFFLCISVGYGLICNQCVSSISWEDCDNNTKQVTCQEGQERCGKIEVAGESSGVRVRIYVKGCASASECNKNMCEKLEKDASVKITKCEVNCCVGDLCNGSQVPSKKSAFGRKCYTCYRSASMDDPCDRNSNETDCGPGFDRCSSTPALKTCKDAGGTCDVECCVGDLCKGSQVPSTNSMEELEKELEKDDSVKITECKVNCCVGDQCKGSQVPSTNSAFATAATSSGSNLEYLYYIIAALVVTSVAIFLLLVIWHIRKRRMAARANVPSNPDEEQGIEMEVFTQDVDKWEIAPSRIVLQQVIGIGSFGTVWKANFNAPDGRPRKMPIAAKCFTPTAGEDGRKALMREIELGKLLGESAAPNIVKFIGCVTTQIQPILVMEYMAYGDLLGYLRKSRGIDDKYHVGEAVTVQLQTYDLVLFALQIATGMVFLGSRGIIHRDLAARNVLLDKNYVCKVTDFGLAYQNFKYGHGNAKKGCIPIKWTAPEILYGDPADLSIKSDVWSYGIVLYEIFTVGGIPYPEWTECRTITEIKNGYRMPKPEHIDDTLYHHMRRCWEENPASRPHFEHLRQEMESYIESKMYLGMMDMAKYNAAKYSKVEDVGAEERPQEQAAQVAQAAEPSKKPIPPPRRKFATVQD